MHLLCIKKREHPCFWKQVKKCIIQGTSVGVWATTLLQFRFPYDATDEVAVGPVVALLRTYDGCGHAKMNFRFFFCAHRNGNPTRLLPISSEIQPPIKQVNSQLLEHIIIELCYYFFSKSKFILPVFSCRCLVTAANCSLLQSATLFTFSRS